MTNSNDKGGELLGQEHRRCWSTDQKLAMVSESLDSGQSVSVVARRNGVNSNQLFLCRTEACRQSMLASELSNMLNHIR